jgi:hypothetical protein
MWRLPGGLMKVETMFDPLRLVAKWIVAVSLTAVGCESAYSQQIRIEPFNPRPSDSITAHFFIPIGCYSVDRLERVNKLISIFVNRTPDSGSPLGCANPQLKSVNLGNLPADTYSVEVVSRDPTRPTRDQVAVLTAFVVSASNPLGNTPRRIDPVGSIALVRDPANDPYGSSGYFQPIKFRVTDVANRAVSGAEYGYSVIASSTNVFGTCPVSIPGSECAGALSGDDGVIDLQLFAPAAAEGSRFLTLAVSAEAYPYPKPQAFVTVGYIDAKRVAQVIPVVEYEVLFSNNRVPNALQPTGYFLAASESDMKLLDADELSLDFRRTYAAFFGVRAGTAGAQPVCRFLKLLPTQGRYFHWFTLDATECAAKRNDPAYVYEGTPFWAYPARADGGCPSDTRGVTRYLFEKDGKTVSVRYSLLTNLKNLAGQRIVTDFYTLDVKGDGIAFCVPD